MRIKPWTIVDTMDSILSLMTFILLVVTFPIWFIPFVSYKGLKDSIVNENPKPTTPRPTSRGV